MWRQPENDQDSVKRTFAVSHTDAQIQDELYTMVDCGGKHFHTVEAASEEILDKIESQLDKKGYLVR